MKKKRSLHLATGIALGTAVAAGATFLYKTKKGKKLRKQLQDYLKTAKPHLNELLEKAKQQGKKLEADLETQNQELAKKTKKVKRKIKSETNKVKKNVFLKSGRPLAK